MYRVTEHFFDEADFEQTKILRLISASIYYVMHVNKYAITRTAYAVKYALIVSAYAL